MERSEQRIVAVKLKQMLRDRGRQFPPERPADVLSDCAEETERDNKPMGEWTLGKGDGLSTGNGFQLSTEFFCVVFSPPPPYNYKGDGLFTGNGFQLSSEKGSFFLRIRETDCPLRKV